MVRAQQAALREYEDRGDGETVSIGQGMNARGQEYHSAYTANVARTRSQCD